MAPLPSRTPESIAARAAARAVRDGQVYTDERIHDIENNLARMWEERERREDRRLKRKIVNHMICLACGCALTLLVPGHVNLADVIKGGVPFGPSVALEIIDKRFRL